MSDDIFDTRFEGKEVELDDNRVYVGQEENITAKDPTMKKVHIGVGWDLNAFDADALDLDVSVFLLDKDNMTRMDEDFIFYNNMQGCEGAVQHHGDSRTGAGDGDDESISIDLESVSFDVMRFLFVITIYKGREKEQNMGMVRNAYIRLGNADNDFELLRFELDEELENKEETGMVVAALNREGPKWHFVPSAEFVLDGLPEIAKRYGLIITDQ